MCVYFFLFWYIHYHSNLVFSSQMLAVINWNENCRRFKERSNEAPKTYEESPLASNVRYACALLSSFLKDFLALETLATWKLSCTDSRKLQICVKSNRYSSLQKINMNLYSVISLLSLRDVCWWNWINHRSHRTPVSWA